jgi:hypothetical protein
MEVIEFRAVKAAATDIVGHYGMNQLKAIHLIGSIVALYAGANENRSTSRVDRSIWLPIEFRFEGLEILLHAHFQ